MALCLVAVGCSPQTNLTPTSLAASMVPRSPECTIDWYQKGDPIPRQYGDLGEIYVSEGRIPPQTCDKGRVREALRQEACRAGADAAVILSERKPNTVLDCYQTTARLLKYGDLPPSLPLIKKPPAPLGGLPDNIRRYRGENAAGAKAE